MRHPFIAAITAAATATAAAVINYISKKQQTAPVPAPRKEALPVSRVVMYQSGIGYVERCAQIASDHIILSIRPDQINDILKSLTVIDRGNGRPVSISLPVDKDTLDTLAQIPDQVRDGGIRALLDAFRGANVKIKTTCQSYCGRIVGVEDHENTGTTVVTLLNADHVLDMIPLDKIRSVALFDKSLADGLEKSLNISLNEGNWKQIELTIHLDSAEPREIAVSYIVAMPVWKPAYRLVLRDDDKGTLQGWAVVSNVTGADWHQIAFSLVSGQPMSFTFDLYKPQFLKRPDLSGLAVKRAAAPEVVASGYGNAPGAPAPMAMGMAMMGGAAPAACAMKAAPVMQRRATGACNDISSDEIASGFTAQAEVAQIGSFDEYRLASKLSLDDGHTALVNLIQDEVDARDTRLVKLESHDFDGFSIGMRQSKSFQTVELVNHTGVALDSGPITLYRNSAVIGEGYLSRTEKDATAYITYANEGRLSVTLADSKHHSRYRLDAVSNGVVLFSRLDEVTQIFTIESHIDHLVTTLVQFKRFHAWNPVDFPEDTVKSDDKYTIPVRVEANCNADLPLTMSRAVSMQYILGTSSSNSDFLPCKHAIDLALEDGSIPDKDREDFVAIIVDTERANQIHINLNTLHNRLKEIDADQASLLKTLEGIKDVSTENAETLRNQIIQRQQNNEQARVEITSQLYELQRENGEIDLRMQAVAQRLKYRR